MATGITLLPTIWTTQPQAVVSIRNDVSAKIIFLPCLGDVNLVNLEQFVNTHSSLRVRKSIGTEGFRYQSDSLWAAGLTIAKNLPSFAEPCILLGVISPTELATVGRYVCDRWIEAGTTSAYAGQFIVEQNATDLRLRYNDGSGAYKTLAFGLTLVVGGIYRFAIDVSVDAIKIYVNGIKTAETAFSMPAIGASIPAFFRVFGRGAGAANTAFTGYEYFIGALQSGRAQQLSENPWQIFAKNDPVAFFSVGASGGSANLTGDNSTQSNTSSAAAIGQTHLLTGADSTQSNTCSVASLSQTFILSGANCAQANTSSAGDIAQTHLLAGANGTQANTSDAAAISQAHLLTGADSTQSNTSSTGSIVTDGTVFLTGADCVQANTCTGGDIGQTHILTGGDCSQANTSSSASLTQTHILSGADCTQSSSSSVAAIIADGTINLSGANATQNNTSSAAAIGQTHILTGANCIQINASSTGAIGMENAYAEIAEFSLAIVQQPLFRLATGNRHTMNLKITQSLTFTLGL